MKLFLKHNGVYILIYLVLLGFVGNILSHHGKVQIHKVLNSYVGNKYLDFFFEIITHLGDGLFAFIVALTLLFFNIRKSIYILATYVSAASVSSLLKHMIYPDIYRPHFVFQYFVKENLNEVKGVDLLGFNSFPSGHALSAFALFFCLLLTSKNQVIKGTCFMLALLAAYSRVYLSQHWLIDIYVGSLIGVSFSLLFYAVFYNSNKWSQFNTTIPQLLSHKKNKSV